MSANMIRWIFKVDFLRFGSLFLLIWQLVNTEAFAQGFWQKTNGPSDRFILSLAINSKGHVFAGTDSGVYRSTNYGNNWTLVNTGLTNLNVQSLAIDFSGYIFAGTFGSGVFRSTDNGDTWMSVNTGLMNTNVLSFAINFSGHIFVGTSGGVFSSTNNGDTWTPTGLQNTTVFSLAIDYRGYILAGTNGDGIFLSRDNGDSWLSFTTLTTLRVYALAINPAGDIFAGTDNGIILINEDRIIIFSVEDGLIDNRVFALTINLDGHIFAGTDRGVSRYDGVTWISGLTNLSVLSLAINSSTGHVFVGTRRGGVYVSNQPPIIAHTPLSKIQIGQPLFVVIYITDEDTVVNKVILNYRKGGDIEFVTLPFSTQGDSFVAIIPTDSVTSRGVEYFLTATDSDGMTREPAAGVFSVQVNVPEGVKKASEQPPGSEQNAYRLISMPLDLDNKSAKAVLEDNLGSYNIKKWRFFALRRDQSYAEFSDTLTMVPGKAFLLIVKDAGKFIDTGAGKSNPTNKKYAVSLHPEWNFIGNPFNFPIPLKNISLKSGQLLALRYHEGTWRDPILRKILMMQPFEGYAVFNTSDAVDTLFINPDLSALTSPLSKEFASTIQEKMVQAIRILAQCQDARDEDNVAAIVPGASSGWDDLDQPEPPVIGEYVSVYFPHPEWNKLAKSYCTDARPEPIEGEVWEFEVKTNIRDKVNLSFEGLESVPVEFEVWLLDEAVKITRNLRQTNYYSVAGMGEQHPKQLKLVIGKQDFVQEKLLEFQVIPEEYELSQNFPNPFNPATTIRYGLPRAARVTLKVYNLLGEELVTLVDDEQEAGYHVAIWDGRNRDGSIVANGLYIYRLQAGSSSMTKKMTLLK